MTTQVTPIRTPEIKVDIKRPPFDISFTEYALSLEDEGLPIEITDLDGQPAYGPNGERVTIWAVGSMSKKFRELNAAEEKQLKERRGVPESPEETRARVRKFIADCCFKWQGIYDRGAEVPFSVETAVSLFERLEFIQNQVDRGMTNHAFFFNKALSSSSTR